MISRKRMRTAMQRFLLTAMLLAATPLLAQTAAATPAISPQDQKGIDGDVNRHFGDAPADPGPRAKLSGSMRPADVRAATRKVADWELAWSQPYFDRIWTWSVLYTGFMAASPALDDPRYRDAMEAMAEKFQLAAALRASQRRRPERRPDLSRAEPAPTGAGEDCADENGA